MTGITESKSDLRQWLTRRLCAQTNREIVSGSNSVCGHLLREYCLFRSGYIASYAAIGGELCLGNFEQEARSRGAKIYYPRFNDAQQQYELAAVSASDRGLVPGKFGINEPECAAPLIDAKIRKNEAVWLVPGIGFDPHGNRLGRGHGYYDRLMADTAGVKIGVVFEWQIVKKIPTGTGDIPVDYIVTDRRIHACRR